MGNTLSSRDQEEGSRGAPGSRPDGVDRDDAEDETADQRLDKQNSTATARSRFTGAVNTSLNKAGARLTPAPWCAASGDILQSMQDDAARPEGQEPTALEREREKLGAHGP